MNWLYTFYFGYWWPSLKGNGPEDVTSLIVAGVLTSIFVPRVRHWWVAREEHLHAKLDHVLKQNAHIIHHSRAIPNQHADGTPINEVPEHLQGRVPTRAASGDHT